MKLLRAALAGIGGALLAGCSYLPKKHSAEEISAVVEKIQQQKTERERQHIEEFVRLHPVPEAAGGKLAVAPWMPGGELEKQIMSRQPVFEITYGIFENLPETAVEVKRPGLQLYSSPYGMTPEDFYLKPNIPEMLEISKADIYLAVPGIMSRAFDDVPVFGRIFDYMSMPSEVLLELKDEALDYMTWELYGWEKEDNGDGYEGPKVTVRIGPIFRSRFGDDEQRQFTTNFFELKLKF